MREPERWPDNSRGAMHEWMTRSRRDEWYLEGDRRWASVASCLWRQVATTRWSASMSDTLSATAQLAVEPTLAAPARLSVRVDVWMDDHVCR